MCRTGIGLGSLMKVKWNAVFRDKGWRLKRLGGFFCALLLGMTGALAGVKENVLAMGEGQSLSLYATSAVLLDADSGRVLYGKNEDAVMAMASTTKIMTCILVLEQVSLDETLSVSTYASSMPKVKLYIKQGEQYTVRDLLHSLMLESHNDSAVALAEHVGRKLLLSKTAGLNGNISEEQNKWEKQVSEYTVEESKTAVAAFAQLMNEKALELGCENTWFITPNGLDATETITMSDGSVVEKCHSTTAEELAKIMAYCIGKSPEADAFLEITRRENYSFSGNGRSYSCTNHNAFLQMMSGALSGKTGFTNKAGYCYVGALKSEGRTFIVALLACGWPNNKTYKWSDTKELMQYGIDNFFYKSFSEEGVAFDESILKSIPVAGGCTDMLGEIAYTDVGIAGRKNADMTEDAGENSYGFEYGVKEENAGGKNVELNGLLLAADEHIHVTYSVKEGLDAPVQPGEVVGIIEYKVDDTVYKREYIVTMNSVKKIDLNWCLEQIFTRFLQLR